MKTIAVTGTNGYIGSNVTKELLENEYNVIGLSQEEKSIIEHPNFLYYQVDLTNWKQVQSIIGNNNIDVLLHFAAIAHVAKGQKIADEIYKRINYLAAKNLFNCAYSKNIRVFFASSVDVYGACEERVLSEDVAPKPVSIYGKTKYMAECSLHETYKEKKDKYLIGRFAPVYSNDHMKDAYKRIYIKYPSIAISLGTEPKYNFLTLENLVNSVVYWVECDKGTKNVVNICDLELVSAKAFIEAERLKGRAKVVIRVPKFIVKSIAYISNKLLYSKRWATIGLAMCKLFDNRLIDKTTNDISMF